MRVINIVSSPKNIDTFTVIKNADINAPKGAIFILTEEITLDEYAKEWKYKVSVLQKRYKYLEHFRKFFRHIFKLNEDDV